MRILLFLTNFFTNDAMCVVWDCWYIMLSRKFRLLLLCDLLGYNDDSYDVIIELDRNIPDLPSIPV